MGVEINVEPGAVYSRNEFESKFEPYSIALDGFVDDATFRVPETPHANFDHHAGVDRPSTRSTSDQVHMEINCGLFDTFKKQGIPTAILNVNDPDEDVCLATWLLMNSDLVIGHANPNINRLVYCEDRLDVTAGAYPFDKTEFRRRMAWVFEPYNEVRFAGELKSASAATMRNIIESVHGRITEHVMGKGKEMALEGFFKKVGGGDGWSLTEETGPSSRLAMFNEGVKAYIAIVGRMNDNYVYTIGRLSEWIQFPLERLYDRLNKEEEEAGNKITESNRWGISNTIGGSPRETGSVLSPEKLQEIVNDELEIYKKEKNS